MNKEVNFQEIFNKIKNKTFKDELVKKNAEEFSKKLLNYKVCYLCDNSFSEKKHLPRIMVQCGKNPV
jgi:hypothetical protein